MKLFLVSGGFDVTYGGPAFSVSRLGLALAKSGVQVSLWAPDGSALTSDVIEDHPLLGRLGGQLEEALAVSHPDILHDNGIWMPHNHALAKWARKSGVPRVVSIRGMLEPWARSHKRIKKELAWWLYQRRDLATASLLHVTAPMESDNLLGYGLGVPIELIPNGVEVPVLKKAEYRKDKSSEGEIRKALFLSRIHPKKGLAMLIDAWGKVMPKNWCLTIAGPDEGGHGFELERLIRARGLSTEISFVGSIKPENREALYLSSDLFVLPTHSENFGMVIGEALAHEVPVLTTKGAPWPWLEEQKCGWWVDVSVDGLINGLKKATACDDETLSAMGRRGRLLVSRDYGWNKLGSRFLQLYGDVIAQ